MRNALRRASFQRRGRKVDYLKLMTCDFPEDEEEARAVEDAAMHEPVELPKSEDEIQKFYLANVKLIHKLLQTYKGLEDYDDLFQEASIGFFKGVKAYDTRRGVKLTTFAYECARNEVKMFLRKTAAKSRTAILVPLEFYNGDEEPTQNDSILNRDLSDFDPMSPTSMSLEDIVCQRDIYERAMEIVNREMSYEQQTVIKRYLEGVPQSEIARELNSSQSNISKTLKNTICELVLKMKNRGIID